MSLSGGLFGVEADERPPKGELEFLVGTVLSKMAQATIKDDTQWEQLRAWFQQPGNSEMFYKKCDTTLQNIETHGGRTLYSHRKEGCVATPTPVAFSRVLSLNSLTVAPSRRFYFCGNAADMNWAKLLLAAFEIKGMDISFLWCLMHPTDALSQSLYRNLADKIGFSQKLWDDLAACVRSRLLQAFKPNAGEVCILMPLEEGTPADEKPPFASLTPLPSMGFMRELSGVLQPHNADRGEGNLWEELKSHIEDDLKDGFFASYTITKVGGSKPINCGDLANGLAGNFRSFESTPWQKNRWVHSNRKSHFVPHDDISLELMELVAKRIQELQSGKFSVLSAWALLPRDEKLLTLIAAFVSSVLTNPFDHENPLTKISSPIELCFLKKGVGSLSRNDRKTLAFDIGHSVSAALFKKIKDLGKGGDELSHAFKEQIQSLLTASTENELNGGEFV